MEVLLGAFYEDCVEEMSDEELPSFARILQCDDMFLARMIAEKVDIPEELDDRIVRKLRAYAQRGDFDVFRR